MRVVTENTTNAKAGEGIGFFVSHVFDAVPDKEIVYFHHKSGLEKNLHSIININAVGQWRFTSYSGFTLSDDGTLIEPINRKSDSQVTLSAEFWHSPTVVSEGNTRLDIMFGSGNNPSRVTTASFGDEIESVFAPTTDVLIGLENLSGTTQYLSVVFNVHEE